MTEPQVDVAAFLDERKGEILDAAHAAVGRTHLAHYEAVGPEATKDRISTLLDLVVESARDHDLLKPHSYATWLAAERHGSGYELSEVQTVINVLEEAIWRCVAADVPAESQGYALGLTSSVLGAVKDSLARGYVAVISAHAAKPLHVETLFSGTEGSHQHS